MMRVLLVLALVAVAAIRPAGASASVAEAVSCGVESVTDGDTLRVSCTGTGYVLRLQCIDAPEPAQKPWGPQATQALRRAVGTRVQVFGHTKDKRGRVVATLFDQQGRNINLALVRQGAVAVRTRNCRSQAGEFDANPYYDARDTARTRKRGIYRTPGLQQQPWRYRNRDAVDKLFR